MAGNMFLKIEEPAVTGESADSQHSDDIQVLSWSHSFNQPTSPTRSSAGSGTVEQANHSEFSFTKYTDSATDDLLKLCWQGNQIGKTSFFAYRADGDNEPVLYLKIEMEDCIVSNVSIGGGTGDIPTETISMNYGKVTYTYKPQSKEEGTAGGDEPVSHDLVAQKVE
ncbi:MAG: type VI secretion system tube protein Hcp [Pseudomonadota bacterium]